VFGRAIGPLLAENENSDDQLIMSAFPHDSSYGESYVQPTPGFSAPREKIADPPTLLVVDDDPVFRELEARALRQQGYNVLQANGAAEALQLAGATASLHLLLTDFVMPGPDGLELVRQFRALYPRVPVLMVSSSLPLIQGEVGKLDWFALLEKSSNFDKLLEKVRRLLTEVSAAVANS